MKEEEDVPQSWEQRAGASLNMEALINLERDGIAEDDFDKSWARMQDMSTMWNSKRRIHQLTGQR